MSLPNFPNITPTISLSTAQTIPLLLSSIALEELALAHIINAEAEKLQFVLGTLDDTGVIFTPAEVSIGDLLDVNTSVRRTLRDVIKKEMLLEFKFENVLDLIGSTSEGPTCGCNVAILGDPISWGPIEIVLGGAVLSATGLLDFNICPNCSANGSFFTLSFITSGSQITPVVLNISTADITSIACDATGVTIRGTTNVLIGPISEMVDFTIRINNNGTVTVTLISGGIPLVETPTPIPVPLASLSFGTC